MIEAVGTSSANAGALRSVSQGAVAASYAAAPAVESSSRYYISSRIRVDNLLDLAILEFRASETGDVVRQYPTESQIRAFQRASELDARRAEAVAHQARQEALLHQQTSSVQATTDAPSETYVAPAPQPAPARVAAPAPSVSAPATSSGGDGGGAETSQPQHSVSTFA